MDRLLQRRVGRIRAAHSRSEGRGRSEEDRAPTDLLQLADLVAGQQEDRVIRQEATALVSGDRERLAGQSRQQSDRVGQQRDEPELVARQPLDRIHQTTAQYAARSLRLLARNRQDESGYRRNERLA